jgi:hypothetical protein
MPQNDMMTVDQNIDVRAIRESCDVEGSLLAALKLSQDNASYVLFLWAVGA